MCFQLYYVCRCVSNMLCVSMSLHSYSLLMRIKANESVTKFKVVGHSCTFTNSAWYTNRHIRHSQVTLWMLLMSAYWILLGSQGDLLTTLIYLNYPITLITLITPFYPNFPILPKLSHLTPNVLFSIHDPNYPIIPTTLFTSNYPVLPKIW